MYDPEKKRGPDPAKWGRFIGLWFSILIMLILTGLTIKAVQYINLW
jgi:hypothetical protein